MVRYILAAYVAAFPAISKTYHCQSFWNILVEEELLTTSNEFISLCNGADPAAMNDQGDTPLHGAAWRGFAGTAQLLLDAGASRDAKNKSGKTPPQLALAKYDDDHEILRVLPKFTSSELAELDDFAVDSSGGESDCEDAVTF